ncbi:MAG TPA: histidine kinase, partial [Streptosporangiaceae bacterium]|nr:histidine kinase [Streptosporangiaceae bacterium]
MPALYAWLHRHPRLVDGVLAVALAFGGLATAVGMHRFLLVPATLGLTIPVVFRRSHPVGAFAVVIAVGALQVIFDLRPAPPDLTILVLLYTLAAYTTRRLSVIGLGICLLGSAAELERLYAHVIQTHQPNWLLMGATLFAGPSLIAWVLGDSMRYRRAYYANLEERAARLERDKDAQARMAAAAERARIARELHDVVAHNVSVMVV